MYRRPGARGAVQGVLSGPYTGPARRLDAAKLPRAVRQRLADSLAGRTEPSALAYERTDRLSGIAARYPAFWGLALAVSSFAMVFAIGFGDVHSARAVHVSPIGIAASTLLFTLSLVVLLRRRAASSGDELAPGRWLLPLDVVDVPRADVRGRQIVTVRPLGDVRDAVLREDGGRRFLVLVFGDGSETRFPVRSEAAGELALVRLEHSQRLLEELTYKKGLDQAFAHDPFFEVRVDDSWPTVAAGESGLPRGAARALLHGPLAWGIAAVLAVPLSWGWMAARDHLSDRAIWLRAKSAGTPEALDQYLAVGVAYRPDAIALREKLLEERGEQARRAKESEPLDPATVHERAVQSCTPYLEQTQGPATHPEVRRIVARLVDHAASTGDPRVPFVFYRHVDGPPGGVPSLDAVLAADELRVVWSFERIFSETCPASVVKLTEDAPADLAGRAGLEVRYTVSWPGPTWTRGELHVHAMKVTFDARLRAPGGGEDARFVLTMPPPKEPSMFVRPRSLFALRGAPPADGAFDDRVYDVMLARAFDRLYDEVYGLFFEGDPRVPLREPVDP